MLLWPVFILQPREQFQPLDLDRLKKKATMETKLYDYGDDWDEGPYRDTIDVVNKNNYSPVGRLLLYKLFVSQLKELLLLQKAFKDDVLLREYCENKNALRSPVFVLGLPRTGTTFLHKLLALDPMVRAPRKWELDHPAPRYPNDPDADKAKRMDLASSSNLNAAKIFAPQLLQLHDSSDLTRAEECIFVLSLFAPIKLITFLFPDHADTVFAWSWAQVYRNYANILKMWEYYELKTLPDGSIPKRWVLKSPVHLIALEGLVQGIPDADIIWTHRDLEDNILSACNLKSTIADVFLDANDPYKIGNGYLQAAETALRRGDQFVSSKLQHTTNKTNTNTNKVIHCKYDQFIQDPMSMIQDIYKQLGYEFADEYRIILQQYLEQDKVARRELRKLDTTKAATKPTLATYGITKDIIKDRFHWYYEKYMDNSDTTINNGTTNGQRQ